jgi:hypothetical protein
MSLFDTKLKWIDLKKVFTGERSPTFVFEECDVEFCIRILSHPTIQNYTGIKAKLRSSSNEWLAEFLHLGGLEVLLCTLERLSAGNRKRTRFLDALLQMECVSCIKEIMNSKFGLKYVIECCETVRRLSQG